MSRSFTFRASVFPYPGMAAWRFVSVPRGISDEIRTTFGAIRRGWGSIPVIVRIGKTEWQTSIFPDKKSQCYLLPMKLEIRKKENIMDGDAVALSLQIRSDNTGSAKSAKKGYSKGHEHV